MIFVAKSNGINTNTTQYTTRLTSRGLILDYKDYVIWVSFSSNYSRYSSIMDFMIKCIKRHKVGQ